MANYNFTMKEFNGTSYDTLYPKTISQQVLLNDNNLANKLGLSGSNINIDQVLNKFPIIETGDYIGTGTYGQDNPTTITCSFSPKFVVLGCSNVSELYWGMFVYDNGILSPGDGQGHSLSVDWSTTNTLKFYSTQTSNQSYYQFNYTGYNYYWIAIG